MKKKNETATTAGNWGEWEEYLLDELIASQKELADEKQTTDPVIYKRKAKLLSQSVYVLGMVSNNQQGCILKDYITEVDLPSRLESEIHEVITDYEGAEPEICMQRLQLLNNLRNYIAKLLA